MEKKPLISFKLSKEGSEPIAFNLNKVQEYFVKLYWESPHDLDVSALILTESIITEFDDVVSTYNPNLVLQSDTSRTRISGNKAPFQNIAGSILHMGDVKTGLNANSDKPDEQLRVVLSKLKPTQSGIPFVVSIHPAASAKFREVSGLRLIIEQCDGVKLLEAHLGRDFDDYDMVQIGMLVKSSKGDWLFDPKAMGINGDFNDLIGAFQ